METPADVGHGHPFLDDRYSSDHILASQDLRGNEVANLVEEQGNNRLFLLYVVDSQDVTVSPTYVIEVLCCSHDVRRLFIFVILHPALSKEFPGK